MSDSGVVDSSQSFVTNYAGMAGYWLGNYLTVAGYVYIVAGVTNLAKDMLSLNMKRTQQMLVAGNRPMPFPDLDRDFKLVGECAKTVVQGVVMKKFGALIMDQVAKRIGGCETWECMTGITTRA